MKVITRLLPFLLAGAILLTGCTQSAPDAGEDTGTSEQDLVTSPLTQDLPPISSETEKTPVNGVLVEYYSGTDLDEFVTLEKQDQIDFTFRSGRSPVSGAPKSYYSLCIRGKILAPASGQYTLISAADDGIQLTLNGETVINDAGPHTETECSATVSLTEGETYPFTLRYYNGEGEGVLKLYWQTAQGEKTLIPADALFLPDDPVKIVLSDADGQMQATAYPLDGFDGCTLVLEKLGSDGSVTDKSVVRLGDADRATTLPALEGEKFRAYLTNGENEMITNLEAKAYGADLTLTIDPARTAGTLSPYLTGACLEDVNHEVYGGIWSQMIYGESFAEAAGNTNLSDDFEAVDGNWTVKGDTLVTEKKSDGAKLVVNGTESEQGSCSVDLKLSGEGPVGFMLKASSVRPGADNFYGYEIALGNNFLRLAKHENNYTLIREYSCDAPQGQWVNLRVDYTRDGMSIYVNSEKVADYTDPNPLTGGSVGLRAWNAEAEWKNLTVSGEAVDFVASESVLNCSSAWDAELIGGGQGSASLCYDNVFKDGQSQRLTYQGTGGKLVLSNSGLDRMGMNFEADKLYEGYLYASSEVGCRLTLTLESGDGSKIYAEKTIEVKGDYQKYSFELTPDTADPAGRFAISLTEQGSVDLGYVYLQPGQWGRYQGLPVRKDVAEALEQSGITVLRYGGCMANAAEYRWKKMLGAPEDRPVYTGWWYGKSSNGFGIVDFLDLCEALGVLAVPDFNSYESPEDMADFVRFALGTDPEDEWVQKRIEMGHPEPYNLTMIEIGNEEKIDAAYAKRFNAIADAIWAMAPELTLVVGDFAYSQVITDPYHFTGSDSGITTLANHKIILDHAAEKGGTVWFDIHWWSESGTQPDSYIKAALSLYARLTEICPESDPKLCIFELNANSHTLERALCNAYAINTARQYPDIFPIICSANCLQVDGCNDNGWDQGLVFMNSDSVWLQPPAYAEMLFASSYQPTLLEIVDPKPSSLHSFSAAVSEDGKTVSVVLLNRSGSDLRVLLDCEGVSKITVQSYDGSLKDVNTAQSPTASVPRQPCEQNSPIVTLSGYSLTVVTLTVE
ncbi:MAG: PA14 domain-containing protein [Eubacteriales bacterium]